MRNVNLIQKYHQIRFECNRVSFKNVCRAGLLCVIVDWMWRCGRGL